jgi:outer membrane cobalamin receptor
MIQYVAGESSGPPDYTQLTPSFYTNLTKARSKGFQGEVSAELPMGFAGSANYVQTVAQVYAVPPGYMGQQPGDALLRRPSHSGSVKLSYARSSDWSLGASADYIGKRPDRDFSVYPSPTVTLPGYVTLGLSASVRVLQSNGTSVSLTGRVENALNRRYEDVFNFPAAGRTILVGARLSSVR